MSIAVNTDIGSAFVFLDGWDLVLPSDLPTIELFFFLLITRLIRKLAFYATLEARNRLPEEKEEVAIK